jgi:hypothetical protein
MPPYLEFWICHLPLPNHPAATAKAKPRGWNGKAAVELSIIRPPLAGSMNKEN